MVKHWGKIRVLCPIKVIRSVIQPKAWNIEPRKSPLLSMKCGSAAVTVGGWCCGSHTFIANNPYPLSCRLGVTSFVGEGNEPSSFKAAHIRREASNRSHSKRQPLVQCQEPSAALGMGTVGDLSDLSPHIFITYLFSAAQHNEDFVQSFLCPNFMYL